VTAKIVEMAREQGAVGSDAELGVHFLFGGAERQKEEMIVQLEWLRADVGFRGDGVIARWDELFFGDARKL